MFGKDWEMIRRHVKSRDTMNIRAHAQKFIEKLLKMQHIEQLPDDHETILNIL